jgi:hypothetical protein
MKYVGFLLVLTVAAVVAQQLDDDNALPLDHPAIRYHEGTARDPVARLGEKKLAYDPAHQGYLPALLKALDINVDSQVLVFSETSTQRAKINPSKPRAIYFNDDVAVGYVQGSDVLELSALDPTQGIKMYTMDAARGGSPGFARRDDCLLCHQGAATLNIPGLLIASVHPASEKDRDRHGHSFVTDHRTPLAERWGGWYVTGDLGEQPHFGNNTNLVDPLHPGPRPEGGTVSLTSLEGRFDVSRYPVPSSDVVALMVLEHQARMTNLLVRIGWDARIADHDLKGEIDQVVQYMLFTDEAPLHDSLKGVSTFTKTFAERGPRDSKGRSLRDFDLKTRMFRYPLSYMIYSPAFDALPDTARGMVYQRLWDVLSAADGKISSEDRRAIVEIVRETKKNVPDYWM